MADRFDVADRDWPARPWIMAAIGAVGGLIVHLLTDRYGYSNPMPVWKQAATSFTAIAVVSFLLTIELRRWSWSILFAVGWGAVIALVGWFTAQYNRVPEIFEFPFFSGILAALIAAPLFQRIRDEGGWRFPYARLHRHAWTDAVIGAASLAFTGVTFMLAWLIAGLFDVIGIEAIKELLKEEWFGWMLAGFAFGGAVGILRERDALVATLQKLVMVVFAVLAPVLAVALAAFLLSLPFTGLKGLWESDIPATPMLLLSGAGAILLANSVMGDGREECSRNIWLRRAALLLVVCVLPLAFFAALSMGQRIGQYGWTPERIWGVVAVGIAIAYGLAAIWATWIGGRDWDDELRPLQTKLAIGLCGLALFLALPIVDFGAISAKSQLARLEAGKVKAEEFDWAAMAFDFGPAGRRTLERIAGSRPASQRQLALTALHSTDRYRVQTATEDVQRQAGIERRVRLLSPDIDLTPVVRQRLAAQGGCTEESPCAVLRVDANRLLVVWQGADKSAVAAVVDLAHDPLDINSPIVAQDLSPKVDDLQTARIEIRPIERRQAYIDGKPVGDPFE
jgi:hypothetical protein